MDTSEKYTSGLYERAAQSGGYLGLYLVALFFVNAYVQTVPLLAMVGLALMLCVPVIVYYRLSASYRASGFSAGFSEIWLEGIATFFFATLIVSIVSVVYMTWIHPGWLADQMKTAIAQGETSDIPQLKEMASLLKAAMEQRVLPSPIQLALDMGWLILFTGSILSMVLAGILRSHKRQQK